MNKDKNKSIIEDAYTQSLIKHFRELKNMNLIEDDFVSGNYQKFIEARKYPYLIEEALFDDDEKTIFRRAIHDVEQKEKEIEIEFLKGQRKSRFIVMCFLYAVSISGIILGFIFLIQGNNNSTTVSNKILVGTLLAIVFGLILGRVVQLDVDSIDFRIESMTRKN